MDSFSSASSGSSPHISSEDFMDQVKLQLAQAYAEEFLEAPCRCFSNRSNKRPPVECHRWASLAKEEMS